MATFKLHIKMDNDAFASDGAKLARFMDNVRSTLTTPSASWDRSGPATLEAWRTIGGKGKPTLKALRALPD